MSQEHFTLTYDGPALESGLMDVRELAPALLATGEIVQISSRLINGDGTKIALQVKSDFTRGSFGIDLILNQDFLEHAKQFLQIHPQIKEAKELLEVLFFYGGLASTSGLGLFKFIKWLRGRSIPAAQITFINNGTVNIQFGDDSVVVSELVVKLAQDESIRRSAEAIVHPLKSEGIEELEFKDAGGQTTRVTKADVDYFNAVFAEGQTLFENEYEAVYEVVRLSFNSDHKWGLTDGTVKIRANIVDSEFWADVRAGLRFAKGDHIKVRVRIRTFKDEAGNLKTEYSVVQVLKHIAKREITQSDLF